MYQARCQTKRHGGVVRPFPGPEVKRSATKHVCHRLERIARTEFDGRTDRVTSDESQHCTLIALQLVRWRAALVTRRFQCHPLIMASLLRGGAVCLLLAYCGCRST